MEKIVNKTCIKNLKESGAPIIIVAAVKEAEAIAYACKDFGIEVEAFCDSEEKIPRKILWVRSYTYPIFAKEIF